MVIAILIITTVKGSEKLSSCISLAQTHLAAQNILGERVKKDRELLDPHPYCQYCLSENNVRLSVDCILNFLRFRWEKGNITLILQRRCRDWTSLETRSLSQVSVEHQELIRNFKMKRKKKRA